MSKTTTDDKARALERVARSCVRRAAHAMDEAARHQRIAARELGAANGLLFRAGELRYDERGGMTEELSRRARA